MNKYIKRMQLNRRGAHLQPVNHAQHEQHLAVTWSNVEPINLKPGQTNKKKSFNYRASPLSMHLGALHGTSTLVRTTAQPTLALDDTHNDSPFFFLAVWELIYHKTYHMSYSQDMARGKIDHVGQNTCPTDVQSNPAWALT